MLAMGLKRNQPGVWPTDPFEPVADREEPGGGTGGETTGASTVLAVVGLMFVVAPLLLLLTFAQNPEGHPYWLFAVLGFTVGVGTVNSVQDWARAVRARRSRLD
jgi:hypothetical protein